MQLTGANIHVIVPACTWLASFTVGLFQDQHYQSLARAELVVKVDLEEKTRPDSGFEEEEEEVRGEEEHLKRKEEDLMIKVIIVPNQSFSDKTRFTLENEGERNGNEIVQTYLKRSKG